MENLEACMQQRIATSPKTIRAPSNVDLPMVEGCTTIPFTSKCPKPIFEVWVGNNS